MDINEALNLIQRINNLPEIYDEIESAVCGVIYKYFEEMLQVEKLEAELMSKDDYDCAILDKYLQKKTEIHNKYWSNSSQYYQPCSSNSSPEHTWEHLSNIEIMQNGDDENSLYIFKADHKDPDNGVETIKAFILKLTDNKLYIKHEFFA